MGSRIALYCSRTFRVESGVSNHAFQICQVRVTVHAFADRRTAWYLFRKLEDILVVGVIPAYLDGRPDLLLVPGIVDRLPVERPKALFQGRRASRKSDGRWQ